MWLPRDTLFLKAQKPSPEPGGVAQELLEEEARLMQRQRRWKSTKDGGDGAELDQEEQQQLLQMLQGLQAVVAQSGIDLETTADVEGASTALISMLQHSMAESGEAPSNDEDTDGF